MPRLIVFMNGSVIQDINLLQSRTTLGRRPANDIVLTDMAVSGEHLAFHYDTKVGIVSVEDLGSTNGTRVNGLRVRRHVLQSGDLLDVGKCHIRYLTGADAGDGVHHSMPAAALLTAEPEPHPVLEDAKPTAPAVFVAQHSIPAGVPHLSTVRGPGMDVPLTKIVTTVGRPGTAVVAINRRTKGYVITRVDGTATVLLNDQPLPDGDTPLQDGDLIELADMAYQFVQ